MRFLSVLVVCQSMWGPCSCLLNVNNMHRSNTLMSVTEMFKVVLRYAITGKQKIKYTVIPALYGEYSQCDDVPVL